MTAAEAARASMRPPEAWPLSIEAYRALGEMGLIPDLSPEQQIEVHRDPMARQFRERIVYGPGGEVGSVALPQFALNLQALFASRQE